jgi:hypothetical protein
MLLSKYFDEVLKDGHLHIIVEVPAISEFEQLIAVTNSHSALENLGTEGI